MRAALRAGKPPHFLIAGARKRSRWTKKARLLLEAYDLYDHSLCGSCGHSGMHALDIANTREFVADKKVCLGCQVIGTFYAQNEAMARDAKGLKVYAVSNMGPRYEDDD